MSQNMIHIEEEMKVSYLDYAMSVIIGRALPAVTDGLKPVQRRILYAMYREGLVAGKKHSKSAGVVGEVLKKYHPHGDSAVYDAMVRLAQDFNMRAPLVDGQGNFGSIDGDPAAAYRYTEARLTKIAEELLNDIDKDTVDFTPNFDETTSEPVLLPSKVPNLLLNGAAGIAVGMATNIPPHNLGELVDGILMMLADPYVTLDALRTAVKGPDFPTGGIICGSGGIGDGYATGRGLVRMRARTIIERDHKGHETIIVTEMPYQVNKASLIRKMAELVRAKKIEGISEIRDESDRDGIRVVIELKRGEIAQVVLNNLYKHTQMSETFGMNMLALVGKQPKLLGLKDILSLFIEHRRDVITRRTRFELRKAEEKAHILEGLKIALDNLDEIIELIKAAPNPEAARNGLIERFSLSHIQAQAILEMRLQRLTGLERDKIIAEYIEIIKEIERLKAILANDQLKDTIIRDELAEIKQKYANPRRTEITVDAQDINIEDMIKEEEMVVTMSYSGYIKRNPLSAYRSQRRGGKGLTGMETREEDFVEQLYVGSTHDYMMFFTNMGRLYWLKTYQIPEAGRTAKGKAIINLLQLGEGERVATAIQVKDFSEGGNLVMFTKKGIVKKTSLADYSNPRAKGIIALNIDEGDELIAVRRTTGQNDLIMGTHNGLSIRFGEDELRTMGRVTRGVIGIRLMKDDAVVSADVVEDRTTLLTVTERGMGKRSRAEDYPVQGRGGKGVISIKTTEKGGKALGLIKVTDDDEIVLISNAGKLIRMRAGDISTLGRNTQGVRLMSISEDERVMGLSCVAERETQI